MILRLLLLPIASYAVWSWLAWTLGGYALLLLLEGTYTIFGSLSMLGRLFNVVGWYLMLGCLSLGALQLFQHVASGRRDEAVKRFPLNPMGTTRALEGCALLMVPAFAWEVLPPLLTLALTSLVVPWLCLSMALHDGSRYGLRIGALKHTLIGFGSRAPLAFALLALTHAGIAWTLNQPPALAVIAIAGYGLLLAFTLCGQLAYSQRSRLLIDNAEDDAAEAAAFTEFDHLFEEAHQLCRKGHIPLAERLLDGYLKADYAARDPLVHERLLSFQHQPLMLEHAVRYLTRLVAGGRIAAAWALLERCVEADPRFRPMEEKTLIALVQHADTEHRALALELLADFDRAYPHSDHAETARLLHDRLQATAP